MSDEEFSRMHRTVGGMWSERPGVVEHEELDAPLEEWQRWARREEQWGR